MKPSFRILFAAAAAVVAVGCGQPDIIDRTQPNYVKKADLLDGQWYIKETIVDTAKTPGAAGIIGSGGKLEKIRWEVQENMLVGYRSYEVVPGADPRVDPVKSKIGDVRMRDGKPFKGNPVYAYRITSHFDRQRQYNAATGEVTNVLVEDTLDRPWYQREYMRVDWANNQILSYSNLTGPFDFLNGVLKTRVVTDQDQAAHNESMVYACSDGSEQKNSTLKCGTGAKLSYLDFTTQAIVDPPSIDYPGYGRLPYCLFNPTFDCESSNVKIRTSVMKVDEARVDDYEPLTYTDKMMVKFGYFRNELYTYSKDRYFTYSGQQFFAMRHNIWLKSKEVQKDEKGKELIDGVTGRKLYKTLPVSKRQVRPVVYYMTDNTPRELWGSAAQRWAEKDGFNPKNTIEASWDRAFRKAVAVPRGLEPYDPGVPGERDPMPQMFFVCESPVQAGGSPEREKACGKPGTYARLGDLRFHMAPYVDQNAGGLLGLGPSAMDPETGEVVNAVANVYGPGLDTWSGSSSQIIDVVNGEVSLAELVTGKDIRDYISGNLNPTDPRRPRTGPFTSQQPLISDPSRPAGSFAKPTGRLADLLGTFKATGLPLLKGDRKATVAQLLKDNPSLEDTLINLPEVRVAVLGHVPNRAFGQRLESDSAFYRQVARNILLGIDPIEDARKQLKQRVDPTIGCFYEYSYSDEDYFGVAKRKLKLQNDLITRFKGQGNASCGNPAACTDAEARKLAKAEVYNDLRREAYRSVMEHEIGHTLGLMHNFIASADALNFQDGYWDLRKETIGVIAGGRRVLPITPQNMADAAKMNERQQNEGMYEYQYSSIMDYGARVNSQNRGTGKYDDAAILFAYSGGFEPGWVEVFNQTRGDYQNTAVTLEVDNLAKVFTARGAHVEMPLAMVEHYTPASNLYTDKYHYSTLPFHFAEANGSFEDRLNQGISRMQNRSYKKWSDMQKVYDRLNREVKSYVLDAKGLGERDLERSRTVVNAAGGKDVPVEVPYMFCSDYEVGANLMCNRNDQGADVYEMTSKWIERFNQSYVFSNFRRDRLIYSPSAIASGKFGRFLGNVPNVYQQWLFNIYYITKYYQLSPEEIDELYGLGDPMWQNYWTMAVVDSTNLLMQQLSIPSAGYHGKRPDGTWEYLPTGDALNRRLSDTAEAALKADIARADRGGFTDLAYVPRGPGRSMFTVFDSFGYDNYSRVNEAGHFWDVYAAMLALITSETNFLGVDRGSDALRYSLPYYLTFNKELAPLFGNYFTETVDYYSPMLAKNADGTATIQVPTYIKANDYIFGFNYPVAPVTPVDGNGNPMPMSKVNPISTWSARFYSQLFSMAFFTQNFNLEYAEFSKVYRLGSDEALEPAAGYETVQFPDPFSGGYIYAALRKIGDPAPTTGAAIVTRAIAQKVNWDKAKNLNQRIDPQGNTCTTGSNCFTASEWEARVRETVRNMEIMRGLYNIFGRAL
ncbi:MAG: zinc-dependent metalloprotease [Myxococcaceae bacterium]|nr:zinc-dependent metalloprotease [Myxococcaceae bacterium]